MPDRLSPRQVESFHKAAGKRMTPTGFLEYMGRSQPLRTRRLRKDLEWWNKEAAKHGVSGLEVLPL